MAIRHKRKATTGYTWLNTDLVDGQVGINTVDGTLHVLKTDNTVQTIQNGLLNIVEDLTPQLGGPLSTLDNNIVITDVTGVIEGGIGKSPDGVYIAYTGTDGIYTDTDGGVNLIPGTIELHGTTVEVQSLIGLESRQVYCSPQGHLYSVLPPAPGWIETDNDNGDYLLDTLAQWVKISGLEITVPQDTPNGDRLDFTVNLHVINNTNRSGSIDISAGKNGSIPTTNGANTRIEPDFDNTIPISISLTNHDGYLTGDTITVWTRIASEDHQQFDPEVHGSSGVTHELTVGVPGEGGSGGDAIWGQITGTLSDQNDLIQALNLKSDITHTHAVPDLSDTVIVAPAIDEALIYDGANWINKAFAPIADMPAVLVGLTADQSIPTSYTDIDWDVLHLENNTSIIEYDTNNTERILIKETGLYFLAFSISFNADSGEEDIELQVVINNATVVPGSNCKASEDDEINGISNNIPAELTAGDYITLQIQAEATGNVLVDTSNFAVMRAGGIPGPEGPEGPPGGATVSEVLFGQNGAVTQTYANSTTINVGTIVRNDAYTVNTVVGGTEITVNTTGWYKVNYTVLADSTSNSREIGYHQLELNATLVPGSKITTYHRNTSDGQGSASTTVILQVTAGQVLRIRSQSLGANIQTIADGCNILIESID